MGVKVPWEYLLTVRPCYSCIRGGFQHTGLYYTILNKDGLPHGTMICQYGIEISWTYHYFPNPLNSVIKWSIVGRFEFEVYIQHIFKSKNFVLE